MNWIDIVILAIVAIFTLSGIKRGFIKTAVSIVGMCAILIVSYKLKHVVAGVLMSKLPFFNFPGLFNGITAMNILVYEIISFIVIFIILYCFLNILISLSGIIEKLLKITVILAIPSKIMGGMLGFLEGIIVAFLFVFALLHFPLTTEMISKNKLAVITLERTPIIGSMALPTSLAMEDISKILIEAKNSEDKDDANFKVLHSLIYYQIIKSEDAQKLIDDHKIQFKNTVMV